MRIGPQTGSRDKVEFRHKGTGSNWKAEEKAGKKDARKEARKEKRAAKKAK